MKLLAVFFVGIIFQLPLWAQNSCPDAPNFPLSGKLSRSLQKFSGLDFVTEKVASFVVAKVAERKLGGHIKVKLRIYSFTDLLAGKLKMLSLDTRGCQLQDMPLGAVTISSTSPVWFDWHKRNGKTSGLASPIALSVTGKLSQEEISQLLATESLTSSLRGLKLDLPGLGDQQLQVLNPKVALVNGRIIVDALMITKGASADTGIVIQISGLPALVGSKLILKDMQVSSSDIVDPKSFAIFLQELFNPIFDFGKLDRTNRAFRLSSFTVNGGSVCCDGTLILAPKQAVVIAPVKSISGLAK